MTKVRIYELAKELGLENKAVIDLCNQLGLEGRRSHSSSLSDDEADKLRRFVIRRAVSEKEGLVREVTREGQRLTEMRRGGVIRRRKKSSEEIEEEEQGESSGAHISLDEAARQTGRVLPTLQPNLAEERRIRDEALRQADALFEVIAEEEQHGAEGVTKEVVVESDVEELQTEDERQISQIAEDLDETDKEPSATESGIEVTEGIVPETIVEEFALLPLEEISPEELERLRLLDLEQEAARQQADAEHLAEVRKRHDIRAPKVLGKIDLPLRQEPAKKSSSEKGEKGDSEAVSASAPTAGGKLAKTKKRKTFGHSGETSDDNDFEKKRPKKKQVLRKDELLDYEGDRDVWRTKREKKAKKGQEEKDTQAVDATVQQTKKVIKIDGEISVGELAKQMGLKAGEVIAQLMKLGIMATINQLIDFETASLIAEELGHKTQNVERDLEGEVTALANDDELSQLELRPPVVTVMGHVDHGKTSLLDVIRRTSVTAGEVGGITQHIGAYNVKLPSGGSVTFLDTPGHEAFTAMRSRGAKVTDIVVLVVAADDGVMPQTIEAINHAKAGKVPIVVAINKMDKEQANPEKVINQLAEYGLVPEDWGGETLMVKVSAHTKAGVDQLLESLNLQSEILELKANPTRRASGTVVEAKLDRGRGPVITVLVQNGTLRKGDAFVAGSVYGKVRALVNSDGELVQEAGPSIPVEVLGSSAPAISGDDFIVFENDIQARQIAQERATRSRRKELAAQTAQAAGMGPLTLERFSSMVSESADVKELPMIVKADVQGAVEALCTALVQVSNDEVKVRILHKGVGAITENDVQLARASNAVLVAFNVRPDARAGSLIESEGVDLLYSRVIYDLVDKVSVALKGRMAVKYQEKTVGRVEIRQTFKVPKLGLIAGSYVLDGAVSRNALVRLLRDGVVMHEGKLASLRRFKDDVKEVQAGYECGIALDGYSDIHNGDILEVYKVEVVQP